ncbi:MAG: endonuclease/exonuclease/phosphatase family protein, partial [Bacteroidales bacterium]|nr:endonuclease/exonuclease/phosphatase family protein [Bacteroidales bacterium]
MKKISFLFLLAAVLPLFILVSCKEDTTVKIMSFNIRNVYANDGENCWNNRCDATAAMLETIQPDVVGIQEVCPEHVEYLDSTCTAYTGFSIGREDGKEQGERVGIYYRAADFELLDKGMFWLSETPDEPSTGWDGKYPRIAVWAQLRESGGKDFIVVNTHLDHRGVDARRNGLALIVDRLSGLKPGTPMVLLGDFNVLPDDECLLALEGKMTD